MIWNYDDGEEGTNELKNKGNAFKNIYVINKDNNNNNNIIIINIMKLN